MRHLALLAFALFALPALALTNVELYRSEVLLDQTVDNPDAKARVDGMKQVIIRASGDRNAISNQVVQKALKQSSQYLSQISYGQVADQPSLRMGFSADHILALLSQAQLPVWPAERANLLVWLVEEDTSDRNIVWEHSESNIAALMKNEADMRGLPLTFPIGDFDDITGVAVSDLWGGFARAVGKASQRYPVEAVLVIRAQNSSLRWTLYDQLPSTIGITRQAPISGSASGSNAAGDLVNQISDYFAGKSAVVVASESSESVKVRFTQINDAVDFFTLENKLKKLSSVASIDILKIQGNEVTFNIHLLSSQQEFEQEVSRVTPVIQLENEVEQVNETPLVDELTPQGVERTSDDELATQSMENVAPGEAVIEQLGEVTTEAGFQAIPMEAPEVILMFEWRGEKASAPAVEPSNDQPESQPAILGAVDEADVV